MKCKNYLYDLDIQYNFRNFLKSITEKYSNNIAFTYQYKDEMISKTFLEFSQDIEVLTKSIRQLGIKDQCIGLIGENSYEWIITFFSIILSENIVVLIDKELTAKSIEEELQRVHTGVFFYSTTYVKLANEITNNNTRMYGLPLGKEIEFKTQFIMSHNKLVKELIDKKTSVILFTSGTLGKSKAVLLSQSNLLLDAYNSSRCVQYYGKSIIILPLYHIFGLVASLLNGLLYGQTLFINSTFPADISKQRLNK